ncbi:hypothetical protein BH10PSE16_BH10PSE16_12670 [soil metagenome]
MAAWETDSRHFLENIMTSYSASHAFGRAVQTARFSSQARAPRSRPAISCTLQDGQAMTVQARESGVLRVAQGRIWLTFSHAGRDRRVPAGDHFLGCGDSLPLSAGQTVVMESWSGAADAEEGAATPACVSWETAAPARTLSAALAAGWHALGLAA